MILITKAAWYFFVRRVWSLPNLLFFLLLLTVLLAGVVAMTSQQRAFAFAYGAELPPEANEFSMPMTTLVAGSAHTNVWEAITYRFLHSSPSKGGVLLPLRFVAVWLVFILPLAGFILSYGAVSRDVESGVIQSLFTLPITRKALGVGKLAGESAATILTLVVGMGLALILATRLMQLAWNVEQLTRTLLFLGIMGLYVSFFISLGTWISAITRSSSRSLWICTSLVIGLFVANTLANNVMGISTRDYPSPPQMPIEVNLYLHSLPYRPTVESPAPPKALTEYIDRLVVYEDTVASAIANQYRNERWWSALLPTQLALEIAGQLLQDEYRSAVDVFDIKRSQQAGVSVLSSIGQILPELVWLSILCAVSLVANAITLTKMEV